MSRRKKRHLIVVEDEELERVGAVRGLETARGRFQVKRPRKAVRIPRSKTAVEKALSTIVRSQARATRGFLGVRTKGRVLKRRGVLSNVGRIALRRAVATSKRPFTRVERRGVRRATRVVRTGTVKGKRILRRRIGRNGNGNGQRARRIVGPMSRKRRRKNGGGSVTGGTGDVKPQWMTFATPAQGAADDYITASLATPIPRFGSTRGRSTVMEILRVDWYLNIADNADPNSINVGFLSTTQIRASGFACTAVTIAQDQANSRVFALAAVHQVTTVALAGGHNIYPLSMDMTDGNGNGILVATDNLHVTGGNVAGTGVAGIFVAKVLYRLVNIGIAEYVGIVQGQQGI